MYHVYWRENGQAHSQAVSTDLQAVREFEAMLADRLHRRKAGLMLRNVPFKQFCDEYINEYSCANKRENSIFRDKLTIRFFSERFPQLKYMEQFDENIINSYKAERKKEGKKESTINRELGTLKSMIKLAINKRYIERDRFVQVEFYKVSKRAKERRLSPQEIDILFRDDYRKQEISKLHYPIKTKL